MIPIQHYAAVFLVITKIHLLRLAFNAITPVLLAQVVVFVLLVILMSIEFLILLVVNVAVIPSNIMILSFLPSVQHVIIPVLHAVVALLSVIPALIQLLELYQYPNVFVLKGTMMLPINRYVLPAAINV